MNRSKAFGLAATLAAALGGCGGGGDDPVVATGPASAPRVAEGAYALDNDDGSGIFLLVLENDQLWGVYRLPPATGRAGGEHGGFVQGNGSSRDGNYTVAELRDYNFLQGIVETSSLSATYAPRERMDIAITPVTPTPPAPPYQYTVTAAAVADYDYDQPANAAAVAGQWPGFFGRTETGGIEVSEQGAVRGVASGFAPDGSIAYSCEFSGSLRARSSGRNVYDANFTLGNGCGSSDGESIAGVGFVTAPSSGPSQLVLMLLDDSRSAGRTFVGQR
ncbi:hypothetical protein [Zeimonas arvi]|uniref:Uncharacterized protein n=1 Tax=Zeimonas arvi TaxID=2498847 RepID=A0A5C8NVK9_9BURK|nr:hypothetical protein [Zeimonas arvi]TXL65257.1 hypothetical protein FHP08_10670 [Zeimonas arvi]